MFVVNNLSAAITFGVPKGLPKNGQKLIIRIKDDGTARAITWNAIYTEIGTALPTTTVANRILYCTFIYNSTSVKWELISKSQETDASTLKLYSAVGANSPVDGIVYRSIGTGESWANIRSGVGTGVSAVIDEYYYFDWRCLADDSAWDLGVRSYFLFDPSSYPGVVGNITGVKLYVKIIAISDPGSDQYMSLVSGTPTVDNTLTVPPSGDDYLIAKFGSTKYASDIKIVDISTGWLAITLNAAGVQLVKDRITTPDLIRFSLRLASDISGTEPSRANSKSIYVEGWMADAGSAANKPYLEITYLA
jgi:hypothetical protein